MLRVRAATMALVLLVVACAGSEAEPAVVLVPDTRPIGAPSTLGVLEPSLAATVLIVSDDGSFAIEVAAADVARLNPSIRRLDPADWPAELADDTTVPGLSGVTVHEVEPADAAFDEPVTVIRRIDMARFGDDLEPLSVPVVTLMSPSADGDYSLLGDLALTRAGPVLFASASLTRFGPVVTVTTGATVEFDGAAATDVDIEPDDALSLDDFIALRPRLDNDRSDRPDIEVEAPARLAAIDDIAAPLSAGYVVDAASGELDVELPPNAWVAIVRSGIETSRAVVELFTEVAELPAHNPVLADGAPATLRARIGVLLLGP